MKNIAQAHCDIPCKIYDPCIAQVAALSVIRLLNLIQDVTKGKLDASDISRLSRLTAEKEKECQIVKAEVTIIWGDYFKEPQISEYPNIHDLTHSIMRCASNCKQDLNLSNGEELLALVNQFADIFWQSKGYSTELSAAPYPPSLGVVKPVLEHV
tara:strand:- start:753 stop:1217 length:465 start_codon:yes stop_codon:yes gene_type:complete